MNGAAIILLLKLNQSSAVKPHAAVEPWYAGIVKQSSLCDKKILELFNCFSMYYNFVHACHNEFKLHLRIHYWDVIEVQ